MDFLPFDDKEENKKAKQNQVGTQVKRKTSIESCQSAESQMNLIYFWFEIRIVNDAKPTRS